MADTNSLRATRWKATRPTDFSGRPILNPVKAILIARRITPTGIRQHRFRKSKFISMVVQLQVVSETVLPFQNGIAHTVHAAPMIRPVGQVGQFTRIIAQVEQLRLIIVIEVQFPPVGSDQAASFFARVIRIVPTDHDRVLQSGRRSIRGIPQGPSP